MKLMSLSLHHRVTTENLSEGKVNQFVCDTRQGKLLEDTLTFVWFVELCLVRDSCDFVWLGIEVKRGQGHPDPDHPDPKHLNKKFINIH